MIMDNESLISALEKGYWPVFVVGILFTLLGLLRLDVVGILRHWKEQKQKDLDYLWNVAQNTKLNSELRTILHEHFERDVFQYYYKISAHAQLRSVLIQLNVRHPDDANWATIRTALPYLGIENNNLKVYIRTRDKVFHVITRIFLYLLLAYTLLLLVLGILIHFDTAAETLRYILVALVPFALAMWFAYSDRPYCKAVILEEVILSDHQIENTTVVQETPNDKLVSEAKSEQC